MTSRTLLTSMPSAPGALTCCSGPRASFDPVPFDAEAERISGRVAAAVIAAGGKPRGNLADLMIAATAIAEGLPLFTTDPAGFTGLDDLLQFIPGTRPAVPHKRPRSWPVR